MFPEGGPPDRVPHGVPKVVSRKLFPPRVIPQWFHPA
jgi:hypothetical protein